MYTDKIKYTDRVGPIQSEAMRTDNHLSQEKILGTFNASLEDQNEKLGYSIHTLEQILVRLCGKKAEEGKVEGIDGEESHLNNLQKQINLFRGLNDHLKNIVDSIDRIA